MTNERDRRITIVEVAIASAFIVWRLAAGSPAGWWKDWILVVAAFWIFTRIKPGSRAQPLAATLVMSYLLGIYLLGQTPLALFVFGIRP
ncbi:MAG: hypothetical protein EHM91_02880 [Planctomycetota bacterium]|nr:MAG: hypothetical protein EHM91_02880 [Planctomycetota bacterium]